MSVDRRRAQKGLDIHNNLDYARTRPPQPSHAKQTPCVANQGAVEDLTAMDWRIEMVKALSGWLLACMAAGQGATLIWALLTDPTTCGNPLPPNTAAVMAMYSLTMVAAAVIWAISPDDNS